MTTSKGHMMDDDASKELMALVVESQRSVLMAARLVSAAYGEAEDDRMMSALRLATDHLLDASKDLSEVGLRTSRLVKEEKGIEDHQA